MALELQLPKELNKCSTHASYWRSFFHSFPLPAAPKMVTSLCPSSSVWFIMWTIPPQSIFLSGNACFYGGVISLVAYPHFSWYTYPPNSVKSLEHVRFIQDPCQERSQSLLLSFMLKGLYSKRESIHVLHHFLGRYRLSPVQGMGSFSIKKVPVWTPLLIWLQQILEKPILSLDLLYRQELWMNEQWVWF